MSNAKHIRITHRQSGELIAAGPLGWGIKSFEGNYYIQRRYLKTDGFKVNFIPGLCIYKFLYVWLDFNWPGGKSPSLGWLYWAPNPLLPFIWFRVAVPGSHAELEYDTEQLPQPATQSWPPKQPQLVLWGLSFRVRWMAS